MLNLSSKSKLGAAALGLEIDFSFDFSFLTRPSSVGGSHVTKAGKLWSENFTSKKEMIILVQYLIPKLVSVLSKERNAPC